MSHQNEEFSEDVTSEWRGASQDEYAKGKDSSGITGEGIWEKKVCVSSVNVEDRNRKYPH